MGTDKAAGTSSDFFDVFDDEAKVVSERRRMVAQGRLAIDRGRDPQTLKGLTETEADTLRVSVVERTRTTRENAAASAGLPFRDETGSRVARPSTKRELTGLALSGGGIRSAAFCLGVLQGLDALQPDSEPQVVDDIDYLSTVSGGGYIGTSLVSGYMQAQGRFPFASKLDQEETIETQHLRDFSNYLAPGGLIDVIVGLIAIIRGLLINAVIFLSLICAAASWTVLINSTEDRLRQPGWDFSSGRFPSVFLWTAALLSVFCVAQITYAVVIGRVERDRTTLRAREAAGRLFVLAGFVLGGVGFLELQAYVLQALFDAAHLHRSPWAVSDPTAPAQWLQHLFEGPQKLLALLATAATAIVAFGNKLLAVATATLGDNSKTGLIKHWSSRIAIYLAATIVPLILWFGYLALSYWLIAWVPRPCETGCDILAACSEDAASCAALLPPAQASHEHAPGWLLALVDLAAVAGSWRFCVASFVVALLFGIVSVLVTPNGNSLHGYYRDRLSRAFLWQLHRLKVEAKLRRLRPPKAFEWLRALKPSHAFRSGVTDADKFKLSSLKARSGAGWSPDVRFAPYLLVNTAVNLEGSPYLNRRGRNADSFMFSPLHIGSEATGYAPTQQLEAVDSHVNIATAMAISGAAASANMGASTIRTLTFSLTALNVRLGYWLPNPRWLQHWSGWRRIQARLGPLYFAAETFGQLDEWSNNVYLTDGGHFDNLGIYELLKRRCGVIVAVDAEADPPMNFESLVRLQRYARIDLGVRIDLPWEDIRRFTRKITIDFPHGPLDDAARCHGPHVAVGRVIYNEGESGVLIYIKSSLSGDESDLVRDYKRRNTEFPHETTVEQFFSEEQFEAYRALGFHVTERFFLGRDRFASLVGDDRPPAWSENLRTALERLNIPKSAVDKIIERHEDGSLT